MGDDSSQSVESFESTITTGNALVDNGGLHGVIEATGTTEFSLSQDSYYPLIVYHGENFGGDQITVSYTAPGSSETNDGSGVFFTRLSPVGLDISTVNAIGSDTDAVITPSTIQSALAGTNVSLAATRDIKVQEPIALSENTNTLTFEAGNSIVIDQPITGVGTLNLHSSNGVEVNSGLTAGSIDVRAIASGGISGSGSISVTGAGLDVLQVGNTTYSGQISGNTSLRKNGAGRLN